MLNHRTKKPFSCRVGLDIGSHSVKGVEIVERGPEIVIHSAGAAAISGIKGKQDRPEPGAVAQAIKNLWSSAGFDSRRVVLALPPDVLYLKWLHLEASDPDELDRTARLAAARGAHFPSEDAIVDYRVLSSRGGASKNVHFVMLVAASSAAVDEMLNVAESAGLDPHAMDIGAASALRSFELQKRASGPLWSGQPLAHCVVGARNTTIAVVRQDTLEFTRTVPIGGNDFTDCVAGNLGVDWAEAERIKTTPSSRLTETGTLITFRDNEEIQIPCENVVGRLSREITRSLRFFTSQFAEGSYLGMTGATTMSGGGALLKGLDTYLQQQGIEVTGTINPFAGFSVDAESGGIQRVGGSAAAYTTAVGLAMADYWSDMPDARLSPAA